jgi:hypothetical protein
MEQYLSHTNSCPYGTCKYDIIGNKVFVDVMNLRCGCTGLG